MFHTLPHLVAELPFSYYRVLKAYYFESIPERSNLPEDGMTEVDVDAMLGRSGA